MPIYNFVCEKCGTRKEKIVKFSQADDTFECVNDNCDGAMKRCTIPPKGTRAILKGGGWFRN